MNVAEIIGKRLKSGNDVTMFYRFPGSQVTKTLPAGKPSPLITSYLASGYYQLDGVASNSYYVKDSNQVKVVDDNADDDSGLFSSVSSGFFDLVENTSKKAVKNAGFVSDGFKESISGLNIAALDFGKDLKKIVTAGAVAVTLIIIIKIYRL